MSRVIGHPALNMELLCVCYKTEAALELKSATSSVQPKRRLSAQELVPMGSERQTLRIAQLPCVIVLGTLDVFSLIPPAVIPNAARSF